MRTDKSALRYRTSPKSKMRSHQQQNRKYSLQMTQVSDVRKFFDSFELMQ
ncbi:hypothetical protein [Nostoc sp. NMS8]|nr:hypothetical protein [Nostoc sp. NMS8]MBN3960935.1 hypothetical protein [Nostoc sp. NMS8]